MSGVIPSVPGANTNSICHKDMLSSCSHARSRHKMYLMEKTDKEHTEKAPREKLYKKN